MCGKVCNSFCGSKVATVQNIAASTMRVISSRFANVAAISLFVVASGFTVTPLEKVISLLEDVKAKVVSDGEVEAAAYNTFTCFCRDTSGNKSEAILSGKDEIDRLSATIEAAHASAEVRRFS